MLEPSSLASDWPRHPVDGRVHTLTSGSLGPHTVVPSINFCLLRPVSSPQFLDWLTAARVFFNTYYTYVVCRQTNDESIWFTPRYPAVQYTVYHFELIFVHTRIPCRHEM